MTQPSRTTCQRTCPHGGCAVRQQSPSRTLKRCATVAQFVAGMGVTACGVAAVLVAVGIPVVGAVELPAVPSSVLAGASQTPPPPVVPVSPGAPVELPPIPASTTDRPDGAKQAPEIAAPALKVTTEASHLLVRPGVTEIVPVAIGQLNRIVTPFEHPIAKTTSSAALMREGNVIYVAPKTMTPVGMYITEKGEEGTAISITFVPRAIPPREITLALKSDAFVVGHHSQEKAAKWERAHPYVEMLRQTLRQVALGQLPQGFAMRPGVPEALQLCAPEGPDAAGVRYSFERGQLLSGARIEVAVGVVRNQGKAPVELRETWCGGEGVAAVAYWPEIVLEPGQASEVYVAFHRNQPKAPSAVRPFLVGGAR